VVSPMSLHDATHFEIAQLGSGPGGLCRIELRQGDAIPAGIGRSGEMNRPKIKQRFPQNRHAQLGAPTAIRTAWSAYALFLSYFDLFIDHLPGEAIDCTVHQ